jgi:hypothetical protein
MASRQEQKKKLREEREQREQEEAAASKKRQRRMTLAGAGLFVVIVVIVAIAVASSGGGSSKKPTGPTEANGLQVSPGPWQPEYAHLQQRIKQLGLPDPSDAIYHIHSHLALYIDGKRVTVPAQIGIDANSQFLTSLHTHDTTGVIHQEAVQQYPFTLGEFFDVWGVKFTKTQIGSYHAGKGLVLQTYVNGKLVRDGPGYKFKPHDNLVVGFGNPGSFPKKVDFKYPSGE